VTGEFLRMIAELTHGRPFLIVNYALGFDKISR
jgi:hypothetical protein